MILSDQDIHFAFNSGVWFAYRDNLPVYPDKMRIGTNSIDVTLDDQFLLPPSISGHLNIEDESIEYYSGRFDKHILQPGEMILGCTRENFDCSKRFRRHYWVQHYEGRSTLGRLGIGSHITAGFGDYGFTGRFTLELVNHAPFAIELQAGMRIGQVYFEALSSKPSKKYNGSYSSPSHAIGPVGPRLGIQRMF